MFNCRSNKIIAFYHNSSDRIEQLRKICGNQLIAVSADFNDLDAFRDRLKILQELPPPDHVLHLAANRLVYDRFPRFEAEDFERAFHCSVLSLQEILRRILPGMAKRKNGKIVIVLSSCTNHMPPSFMCPYVVSKYALLGLTKALAAEYAEKGICVNALSPEMVETRFLSEIPELIVAAAAEKSRRDRILTVSEVLPAIEFLLSEASDTVNGQNLQIS